MTWNETHERTRIIHEVEEAASSDLSGAVPWREEWSQYFDGPDCLVKALRARWNRMCEAQLDADVVADSFTEVYGSLRRAHAGVLAILARADAGLETTARAVIPVAPRVVVQAKRRLFHFNGGPVLPG
ncbi:MAG: hypothetical protein NTX33_07155 [Propionibacteriales bacterium]|nr:hypothetical protein [Propionibacteriales bacterium]